MLDDGDAIIRWVPFIPAVLLLLLTSGAHDLSPSLPGEDSRTWAYSALSLGLVTLGLCVAYAGLTVWRPEGSWWWLAAPRAPLTVLAAWATGERLDQIAHGLGLRAHTESWWEDAASLSLLGGVPLALRQVIPGLPLGPELLGPLAAPVGLVLLATTFVGVARLSSLAWTVARSGSAQDL